MIFRKIIGTFSNKLLSTLLSFVLVVVSSQILGASGKGEISLFIANIVLVLHFGNLISGTSIVYLTPRIKPILLLIPAYLWCFVTSVGVSMFLYIMGYANSEWIIHLIILSFLYNLLSTNYMVILGQERIKIYNILTLLVVILTLLFFVTAFYLNPKLLPIDYIKGLYFAYGVVLLLSILAIHKEYTYFSFSEIKNVLHKMIKSGFTAQLSNIITFVNYRFSYYILNDLFDTAVVGVFSVGVAISEAMWLMSKSIALVQYTKIVNETNLNNAQKMTFKMAKLSFWVTLSFLFIVMMMPDIFYSFLFGKEFIDVKYVIYALSLGVISIATSTTFSHYFGGIGKFNVANISSTIGLFFTLTLTYFLSVKYGMIGAGISASISYFTSAVYLYYKFNKITHFTLKDLIPTRNDFISVKNHFYNKTKGFFSL